MLSIYRPNFWPLGSFGNRKLASPTFYLQGNSPRVGKLGRNPFRRGVEYHSLDHLAYQAVRSRSIFALVAEGGEGERYLIDGWLFNVILICKNNILAGLRR